MREFMTLCATVDQKYAKKFAASAQRGTWGGAQGAFFVGERRAEVKFDVVSVSRDAAGLVITVALADDRLVTVSYASAAKAAA